VLVITKSLAAFAVASLGLDAALASDIETNRDAITNCVTKGLVEGKISAAKLAELQSEVTKSRGEELLTKSVTDAVSAAMAPINETLGGLSEVLKSFNRPDTQPVAGSDLATGQTGDGQGPGAKAYAAAAAGQQSGGTVGGDGVRVKCISEQFDRTTKAAHYTDGRRAMFKGADGVADRALDMPSQLDKAIIGATLKHLISKQLSVQDCPRWAKMTDMDRQLVAYAANELDWIGPVGMADENSDHAEYGYAKGGRLNGLQVKAVLDPGASGGLEAVPIVFDDIAILTPLLSGELLPHVDMRTTIRRRVEGFRVGNPSVYWTTEGATPTEFNTDGFIGDFNTNIFPCVGWMELGLDFEEDSPVRIADLIISRYGQRMTAELDRVIAVGNGTSEPLGILNTVGATEVNSDNGFEGPLTVGDWERLMFAIPKELRAEADSVSRESFSFLSNELLYQLSRSIPVGTGDQRRVFGMTHSDYELLMKKFRINHSVSAGVAAAVCLNRYTMYRRAGFSVRRITEDGTLAKQNKSLLVVRQRYGGQMNLGSAVAIMEDAIGSPDPSA